MNVAAHQEKDKNEETKTPVLRSLKGQHGEKMVCERGVPVITRLSGRSTAISTHPKRDRGLHHHVKAAVDWCCTA